MRGRRDKRVRHDEQLLGVGAGDGTGAEVSGLDGGVTVGKRERTSRGGDIQPVGDGEERWRGQLGGYDAALLPVDGRDDHDLRYGGKHGRGDGAWGLREAAASRRI